ncbi:hypothetical protein PluDJC_14400 [Photorhabdus laumondii subsp. laumondii]|nr:hypothetical protein PluDJC_14400 [Photorhabdus laumondii subsp. laumondii]
MAKSLFLLYCGFVKVNIKRLCCQGQLHQSCSIPVILQVASLLAAFAHPGHIVCYAPGDSLPCRRDAS